MVNEKISCVCLADAESPSSYERIVYSFLRQSYKNKELIFINNTDRTLDSSKITIRDPNVKLLDLHYRLPAGQALNQGIQFCQGEIICLFPADSWSKRNRLSEQYKIIKNGVDACYLSNSLMLSEFSGATIEENTISINTSSIMSKRALIDFGNRDKGETIFALEKLRREERTIAVLNTPELLYKLVGRFPILNGIFSASERRFLLSHPVA